MSAIRHLWAHHRPVLLLFFGAAAVTVFFLARLTLFALYWSDPAHRNLAPEPWMTPGYIAHSWGRDPEELARHLGAAPGRRMTLEDIARARGVPVAEVIAELTAHLTTDADR
ncbi:hypothetical protein [Marimonas arenosa]|uniref:Uncharacterized protein n=1 Tax=Marimonas arenosa TaxID=1795305 RepID=A0AAE3WAE4_9RHOB|nr:hypothetical protein [Marimonas arenosa]MDQ2089097.1 hypothetical protein [Marimonas arenosa]